ncbi:hypothetical protein C8A00DRAFT_45018 [Chaetomidium leptoderma]|uniref:RNase T2-like C-terminal domain-containing protein n=1 Tax=Chaetomidium leptoderma TaxID=669021 RepID=A0AAN6VHU5_9PEZI|nr:hypothetical protein C8A00DRAFT_45018 [Chaetomidium leptoderma]
MHLSPAISLTLASLAAGAAMPSTSSSQTFTGTGQLRTRWNEGDHADLGCLTNTGLWTANNKLCGTFTSTQLGGSSLPVFSLATPAGPCKIYGAQFTCGQGNEAVAFGLWPWPNSIPGVDCLRWGQYGLMASSGRNPPNVEDPPQEIHLVSYIETGKYVWLTWGSLSP